MRVSASRTRWHRTALWAAVTLGTAAIGVSSATAAQSASACPATVCLGGSAFESGDGNTGLDWNAGGTELDWAAAGGAVHYRDTSDLASGSLDDAFGQGAKEDLPNPNIVLGSIPKNKSDLTHFLTAYETKTISGTPKTFLYVGWNRANTLGNANMDFEFNQNPTQTYANPALTGTPLRTAGDILVTFDFPGSGTPVLSMLKWVTATNGTASNCFSTNALPCWGLGTLGNLSAGGNTEADAGVSSDGMFGEAGINLTDAGAFSATGCTTFGDGMLKSRSSSAFTSEVKDYVQLPKNAISVSNCGHVVVHKRAAGTSSLLAGAAFTISPGNESTPAVTTLAAVSTPEAGVFCLGNLRYNRSYTITESVAPANYAGADPQAFVPTASNDGGCGGVTTATAADKTFVDSLLTGSIIVKKVDGNGIALGGAAFTATPTGGSAQSIPAVAGNTGLFCLDNLPILTTYAIDETTTPSGYNGSTSIDAVTVAGQSTCAARLAGTVTPERTVTNLLRVGSLLIAKVDGGGAPLAGAAFSATLTGGSAVTVPAVAGRTGLFCLGSLPIGGAYAVTETIVPTGYSGSSVPNVTISTESTCSGRLAETVPSPDVSVTNNAAPGTISIVKLDDRPLPLNGAGFTLYVDTNGDGTWQTSETTVSQTEVTTSGTLEDTGKASFTNVALGKYCVVETTTPAGFATADPQCATVGLGSTTAGQSITLTFTDPRLHKVIVLVCHTGTNTLDPSTVTLGSGAGSVKTSLASSGLPAGWTEAQLCGLGGASYGGLGHGTVTPGLNVN